MRALVGALALVALAAQAQQTSSPRFWRFTSRTEPGRNTRGLLASTYAQFEFAPASGAGMGSVCACTTPTGAKGEALTFSRTSTATCTKTVAGGLATTGIADGDLLSCASGQPRVEYDSAGTLGLLVESSRTNSLLWSQDVTNAAWVKEGSPSAATVTADQAVAPDGTTTADRLQAPATSAAQFSDIYQTYTTTAIADATACSAYIKGNGTTDTTDICLYNGAAWSCAPCAYSSASWTRCSITSTTGSSTTTRYCKLGNNSAQNGAVARNALDAFVWGFSGEAGAYATSYIPTTSAAAVRSVDTPYFVLPSSPGAATGSMAASVQAIGVEAWPTLLATSAILPVPGSAANSSLLYSAGNSGTSWLCLSGNSAGTLFSSSSVPPTGSLVGSHRGWCSFGSGVGGVVAGALDTNTMTASGATSGTFLADQYLSIGNASTPGTNYLNGIFTKVCRDPSPTRCR